MNSGITIITGGSSGLGLELAKLHYMNNDNVCIVGRSSEKLKHAKEEIERFAPESSASMLTISGSVGSESDVRRIFEECEKEYTVCNVYNVAGIGAVGRAEDVSLELINEVQEANLTGLILVSTYALRVMKETGGNIINVMSTVAKRGNANEAVYCAMKWGARGYTESIQNATKGSDISVIAVYPGGMKTDFWISDHVVSPDLSDFMDPHEVARVIFSNIRSNETLRLLDLTIVRR